MTQTSNRFLDEMARLAREENEALKVRIEALEGKGAEKPAKKPKSASDA